MRKLSTGDNSTLGNYRRLASLFFGPDSKAVTFLNQKIAESPNGEDEEVIADEGQMIYLLNQIARGVTNDEAGRSFATDVPITDKGESW